MMLLYKMHTVSMSHLELWVAIRASAAQLTLLPMLLLPPLLLLPVLFSNLVAMSL